MVGASSGEGWPAVSSVAIRRDRSAAGVTPLWVTATSTYWAPRMRPTRDASSAGRGDAHLVRDDGRLVQAADGAAGAAEQFAGQAASRLGGVRVHVRVRGFQLHQPAGVRAQVYVGRVHHPVRTCGGEGTGPRTTKPGAGDPGCPRRRAGPGRRSPRGASDRAASDRRAGRVDGAEPGRRRATSAGVQRPTQQTISSASMVAPVAVRTRPLVIEAGDAALVAGQRPWRRALRAGDQALDQGLGQQVALFGEPGGRGVP